MITVSKLLIYPVKSCGHIELETSRLGPYGLKWDRTWVIAANFQMLSQRECPKMVLITPNISGMDGDNPYITLSFQNDSIRVPVVRGSSYKIGVWKDQVAGFDQGDLAAEWLSSLLEQPVRLYFKDPGVTRTLEAKHVPQFLRPNAQTAFADGYPILLLSEESVEEIQSRMPRESKMPTFCNFRPNILIKGCSKSFQEDDWLKFSIGNTVYHVASRCTRCIMTSNDPSTGKLSSSQQPLKTLQKFRRVDPGAKYESCVGINVIHNSPGVLCVGQELRVHNVGQHDRRGIWMQKSSDHYKLLWIILPIVLASLYIFLQ
jgi:uncharacterized protein YcbX